MCGEQKIIKSHESRCNMEVNLSDFVVSTVPCDGFAPLGTGASADRNDNKVCVPYVYWDNYLPG